MTGKRQILVVIFFCGIYSTGIGQKLVAYYNFDNNVNDFSGNNNNGNIHGSIKPCADRFGNPCGAIQFDGASYIEIANSPSLETINSAFTITVWYKFEKIEYNTWLTVLCKGATNKELTNNPQFRFQVQQNITNVMNSCTPGMIGGSSTISINTASTKCDLRFKDHLFESNKWCFYALVYDGGIVSAYMDTQKVFEFSYGGLLEKNTSPLIVGMDEPGNTEYFKGHLDDLYIYNSALNEQQIHNLYLEKRATNPSVEEFQISQMQNLVVSLPQNSCLARVTFAAPSVTQSGCGSVSMRQSYGLPSGSNLSPGKHLITYEATSTTGYQQHSSFYVIVKDITAPILKMPRDTVIFLSKGVPGIVYKYKSPEATDNCGVKSVQLLQGLASGSFFNMGKHIIIYKAIDGSGNSTQEIFSVEIKESPEIVVKRDLVHPNDAPNITPPAAPPTDSLPLVQKDTLSKNLLIISKDESVKITEKDTVINYLPNDLSSREITAVKYLEVDTFLLSATIYDNGVFDGDTVSIFLNRHAILSKEEVTVKGRAFRIEIDTTMDNELLMYAENLGAIPPNTALLVLFDGNTRHEINLFSTLSTNGAIKIRKRKSVTNR